MATPRRVTRPSDIAGGYYVYLYGKTVPLYVGKGSDARAFAHLVEARQVNRGEKARNNFIYALAKMLREGTKFSILVLVEGCVSDEDAYKWERLFIQKLRPKYNRTEGGNGFTSETSRALVNSPARLAGIRRLHADPVYQAKLRAAAARRAADPRQRELGRNWAAEQAEKRRAARAARPALTPEALEALRISQRAKWRAAWPKSKQYLARQTAEGRLARNVADRERRLRRRLEALGLTTKT